MDNIILVDRLTRDNIILSVYFMASVITSEQIKAARSLLRWDQTTLCSASKVSLATIKNIERKPGVALEMPRL
jgi:hypothetical protein